MSYTKQTWVNGAAGGTPINATRLNYMESGIETVGRLGRDVYTKAQRLALATAGLPAGFQVYESDTDRNWQWSGTKWRYLSGGAIPHIKVRRTTVVAPTAGVWWAVPWDSRVNSGTSGDDTTDPTMWSGSGQSKLIAPIDGLYTVTAAVCSSNASVMYLGFLRNYVSGAVDATQVYRVAGGTSDINGTMTLRLAANDYVMTVVYAASGASISSPVEAAPSMSLTWIGNY